MEIIKEKNKVYILNDKSKEIAFVTFPQIEEGVVEIQKTFVDDSLRGLGIASKLMEEVYNVIKENGYKAVLKCSYAVNWFSKNQDKNDIILK